MQLNWLLFSFPFIKHALHRKKLHPLTLTSNPNPISTNEQHDQRRSPSASAILAEQDRFWTELKQNCVGCWSGGIVHTTVQNDKLVAKRDSGDGSRPTTNTTPTPLNMRLRVNVPRETPDRGTWNVWNVEEKGDELVIPISRVPFQHGEKDSQLA